jgi:hypothetical protein
MRLWELSCDSITITSSMKKKMSLPNSRRISYGSINITYGTEELIHVTLFSFVKSGQLVSIILMSVNESRQMDRHMHLASKI